MKKCILGILLIVVLLLNLDSNKEGIYVDLVGNEIVVSAENLGNSVLGVAFHVEYDGGLDYLKYSLGDFFQEDETLPIVLLKDLVVENTLVIGVSLKRGQDLVTGSGEIIRLVFNDAVNDDQIKITNAFVSGLNGNEILELEIDWY